MGVGPERSCAGCRVKRPQGELLRVSRAPDGSVRVDTGPSRSGGRGAYVCFDPECARRALGSGALKRTLKHPGPLPPGFEDELERATLRPGTGRK